MKLWIPLVLGAGLAAGAAFRRPPEAPPAARPAAPAAPAVASPPPAPAGNDVRLLSLACVEGGDPAALRERLRAEPQLWREALDVLCAIDDPEAASRAAGALAAAVDAEAEAFVRELLRSGPAAHGRRVAVAVLARRESPESLSALIEAARGEPDRIVRYEALKALALRKDQARSEAVALAIQDVLRGRAQGEADIELRNFARRLSGQAVDGDAVASPARSRRAGIRLR